MSNGRRLVHSRRPHDDRTGLTLHWPLFLINALDELYEDRIGLPIRVLNALRLPEWLTESHYFNRQHLRRAPSTTQAPFKGPELRDVVKLLFVAFGSRDESERSAASAHARR
ncbi:hypothetical protein PUNSTDRAFT_130526 [Punctularia strigosozonata HHB-11173 SS5]|uniref:uncharacterized protein n=1 Tax=Punctularia strigosozonata (strain HHB-11173) TaxID=741275 RepID=UPI00044165A0|nr:uncharacterized protein PUNSTDRAFT_130526 [Punctularia strigosozonata HHB-11173 SS5]EIN12259.1 hypothetical protein PUNSTDRAFT_130526 [Punctularia strigosozonata HHB-11173 SS5]